jgi:hypothetical protein
MLGNLFVTVMFLTLVLQSQSFSPSTRSLISSYTHLKSSSRKGASLEMRWGIKTDLDTGITADGKLLRDTVPFELRGFSLPVVVFSAGLLLIGTSFAGFFLNDGNSDGAVSSLGFVYGIPVFLIGLSLWYAEIKPVEVITSDAGDRAWENHASETFIKIKQDVTRHRYGDDAHLDSTLDALGLRLPAKKYPKLLNLIQEEEKDGQLSFTLTFQSVETPFKIWNEPERVRKYCKFFGPNVKASVQKVDGDKRIVSLKLTTTTPEEYEELLRTPVAATASTATAANSSSSNNADSSAAAQQF